MFSSYHRATGGAALLVQAFFPFAVLLVTTLSTAHGYMQIPPVAIHTYAIAIVSGRVSGAPGSIANAAAHPLRQDD
jgi:hypothetical protein